MDDDGFVFIVDRTKDMLLCSGYNVYPRNLEEAIYEHPAVAEVCVIGITDEYRGQSPKAFVKLKDDAAAFTLGELQAFLKDKLGKHEMVQALDIRAELPKTAGRQAVEEGAVRGRGEEGASLLNARDPHSTKAPPCTTSAPSMRRSFISKQRKRRCMSAV